MSRHNSIMLRHEKRKMMNRRILANLRIATMVPAGAEGGAPYGLTAGAIG